MELLFEIDGAGIKKTVTFKKERFCYLFTKDNNYRYSKQHKNRYEHYFTFTKKGKSFYHIKVLRTRHLRDNKKKEQIVD